MRFIAIKINIKCKIMNFDSKSLKLLIHFLTFTFLFCYMSYYTE